MRKTKIVATIGPASDRLEVLLQLVAAGMNVCRLNMSHGRREDHARRLGVVRQALAVSAEQARDALPVAVLLDLRGPEIRIGTFPADGVDLLPGQLFRFVMGEAPGTPDQVSVDYAGLADDVKPGTTMLLDDGNLVLVAREVTRQAVTAEVVHGGRLGSRKKINLPGVRVSLPSVSPDDEADIRWGVEQGVDFLAASFVRSAEDVLAVRRIVEQVGGRQMIIAKIESQEGVDRLDEILEVADGLMVARGDLGVEVPVEEVPLLQKRMIARANALGRPVITATQMLESMVKSPRPTRAEATDVANAIWDGTDAVMLSAETAVGAHPVEAVRTMAQIALRAESAMDPSRWLGQLGRRPTVTDAIGRAVAETAKSLGVAAIVTATHSGHTARMIARYRPESPVVAVTSQPHVARQLSLSWGVRPVVRPEARHTDEMVDRAIDGALCSGLVKPGDLIVLTAGVPLGVPGTTNLLQVHTVSEILLRGTGVGRQSATGRVRACRTPADARALEAGEILVAPATDADWMEAMRRAAGLVTEEGGLTSHAAVAALSLGVPAIVGAPQAVSLLPSGDLVTVDAARGLIYRGQATVR